MLRRIRTALALRALERAVAAYAAYQSQPADGPWSIAGAVFYRRRMERAEQRLLKLA